MRSIAVLSARGVCVQLGARSVVSDVHFDAAEGELSAIVGPNGSGKTTLLRALAGLLAHSGTISLGARDASALAPEERARLLAYLPQTSGLTAMLSVRQVVALGRYAARPGWLVRTRSDDSAIDAALDRIRIRTLADQAYPKLSGGEQRLVLLARALATGARILLLDEPTASLDVKHSLESFALLAELAQDGYTIVVVLHDLDDVQRYAAHAILLDRGRVRAAGPPRAPAFVEAAESIYGVSIVPGARIGFEQQHTAPSGVPDGGT